MNAVYLLLSVLCMTVMGISSKEYNRRTDKGAFTFVAVRVVFALLFFVFSMRGAFQIDRPSVWYAVAFAICFALANLTSFLALKSGPFSLTMLFTSYSLLIPTGYGIFILDEQVTWFLIGGLVLLVISIFLSNYEKKGDEKKITLKWVIFVVLNLLTNGGGTTIQKVQQDMTGGLYKNEFMIVALSVSALFLFAIALVTERKDILHSIRKGTLFSAIGGLATGALNLFVMVLAGKMPASIMYPVISAGSIILPTIVALTFYKEKLSKIQLVGVAVGILSVVFLNI